MFMYTCVCNRLVLNCGLAHLNANARDESNANAQQLNKMHLNQIQMQTVCYNYVFCYQKVKVVFI